MLFDYPQLATPQHRLRSRFRQTLFALTEPVDGQVQALLSMTQAFDLDAAVGVQLDTIGLWVGVSRRVPVPITGFFSLNTGGLGFNQSIWKGPFTPDTGLVLLDDEDYRALIRVMILADHWDGTLAGLQNVYKALLPDHTVWIVDNFNMTLTVHVTGAVLTPVQSALLQTGRLASVRPAGVRISSYVLPT